MKLTDNDLFQVGVKALIRNNKGKILLLHDQPHSGRSKELPVYWDLPGGRIKDNADAKETLIREVEEETSIKNIAIKDLIIASATNFNVIIEGHTIRLMILIYECKIVGDYQIALSEEHQDYRWFEPKKAAELLSIKYPKGLTEVIAKL